MPIFLKINLSNNSVINVFCDPVSWYFQTMEAWESLFISHGFTLTEVVEPLNPKTGQPASVIFVGELVC